MGKYLWLLWEQFAVCKITFETWDSTLLGHNKVCAELSGHCVKIMA